MIDHEKVEQAVRLLLEGIGEDVNREGLIDTPDRIARMYEEIFGGLTQTAEEPLSKTFHVKDNAMVLEKDITFYSTCEHHFMPFYGKAHIAYIPDGKVVGLSKLARTVEVYAKRPQIQEQLTAQIADALMEYLKPQGAMVMLEEHHDPQGHDAKQRDHAAGVALHLPKDIFAITFLHCTHHSISSTGTGCSLTLLDTICPLRT